MDQLDQALEEDRRVRPASLAGLGVAVIVPKPLAQGHGWTITVAARHHPALFASMAGVLALYGVNILGADLHIWQDGTELHRYHTANPPDTLFIDEIWARIRQSLRYALRGKLCLDEGILEKRTSPLTPRCPDLGLAPSAVADNGASEYYTLLTVRASDRPGTALRHRHGHQVPGPGSAPGQDRYPGQRGARRVLRARRTRAARSPTQPASKPRPRPSWNA